MYLKGQVLSKNNVDLCRISISRVKAYSILCVQCGKLICSGCVGVRKVIQTFLRDFACKKYEGNIGDAVEHEEALYNEVDTVRVDISR